MTKATAMMRGWMGRAVLCALFGMAAGCGAELEPAGEGEATADGVRKVADGKADAWNWRNAPTRFRINLEYRFDQLPNSGQVTHKSWAETYWPYYEDGINARWQGKSVLSPAEKYDRAFNNWTEPEGFMDLRPFDPQTCEWDQAYYDGLGPAAEHTHRTRGNWQAINGVDDDGDGVADKDECAQEIEEGARWDLDGIESWFGVCHAWAPAAIMEEEPLKPVTRNGVTFETSDIKALIIAQYDRTSAYMVGGRCNENEIERDDNGRISNDDCRDINAGSFHLITTNLLGMHDRPMVIERTTNYEVWNQPFIGYEITDQREIDVAEAHRLLEVETEMSGTGEVLHDIEEGSLEARALLRFANEADFGTLDDDAGLYSRSARNLIGHRAGSDGLLGTGDDIVIRTLQDLDDIPWVGASTFDQLRAYAMANGYDRGLVEYRYNPKAVRFVEVRMTTNWLTESHPRTTPTSDIIERWTMHDNYHYILELDEEGRIIGGEWLGESIQNHPDFLWLPTSPASGNPFIDLTTVRELIAESRADEDGGDVTEGETVKVSSDEVVAVPDGRPVGASSTLNVTAPGRVGAVRLSMTMDHTYRGDMQIELRHNGTAILVFDGGSLERPWDDDIVLDAQTIDGFSDVDAAGEWTLHMVDTFGVDPGTLTSWSLEIDTTP